jgi:hypothetical protein
VRRGLLLALGRSRAALQKFRSATKPFVRWRPPSPLEHLAPMPLQHLAVGVVALLPRQAELLAVEACEDLV